MSKSCPKAPENKKAYLIDIGKILVKEHGKKKYYKPEEVKKAHQQSNWYDGLDFSCWGMSTYCSRDDFNSYHQQTGEECDYTLMKTEMIEGLSISHGSDSIDQSDFDMDASWLDMGDLLGNSYDGIGDLIGGIFEGL
jgi:hypothetical protein